MQQSMRVVKYKLVEATSLVDLTKEINKKLRKGWFLYGDLLRGGGLVFQPMVKKGQGHV